MEKANTIKYNIKVRGPDGKKLRIERLNPDSVKEVMGVFQKATGSRKSRIDKIQGIIKGWFPLVTHGYLLRNYV